MEASNSLQTAHATISGSAPGEAIIIDGVPNLRDLGGWSTPDGKVVSGRVYRSAEFGALEGTAASRFEALGIRTVFDLRTQAEMELDVNVLPAGTAYVVLDILADKPGAGPAQMLQVLTDPKAAEQLLGNGKSVAAFEQSYREFVTLPSAIDGYRRFFTHLAEDENLPGLFHCTTGKDRTGWAAASLLMLLGVSDDDVLADYLLTNDSLVPSLQPMIDKFASIGGDPELLRPVIGVQRSYLDAARAEMQDRYGDVEKYFADGLGLSTATIDALRSSLVVPQ